MIDRIETTPQRDVATQEIEQLVEEWRVSHALSRPLWPRREPREAAHTALQGLRATWPRTSIEPMGLARDGAAPKAVRARQAFLSAGPWHEERLLHQHGQAVETDLGADEGGCWSLGGMCRSRACRRGA